MQDKKKRNIELLVLGQYMRKQILAFTLGTHGLEPHSDFITRKQFGTTRK